jgi:magnesium chelatase family protein
MTAIDKLKLTARSYHKLLKLARTIADMVDEKNIQQMHLLEAISYRQQDKRQ